jgi:hypothetical protein
MILQSVAPLYNVAAVSMSALVSLSVPALNSEMREQRQRNGACYNARIQGLVAA